MSTPLAYFLTWTTYGSWLHGDRHGWVNKLNACPGAEYNAPCRGLENSARRRMKFPKSKLTPEQKRIVEKYITEVCQFRRWELLVVSCRSNHVHIVVKCGDVCPETVMNQFKSYATRGLRQRGHFQGKQVWTRGGSTRYINSEESLWASVRYIRHQ